VAYDTGGATSGNFKHWVIGIPGNNATGLYFGYSTNQTNPHHGIGRGWGSGNDHSIMWMLNDRNVYMENSLYAGGYLYSNNSIRIGEIWGYGGIYRSSGDMMFGIESGGWRFHFQNSQRVYIGSDGNIWMSWAGAYISTLLDNKASRQDGTRYTTNFNSILSSGFYNAEGQPANAPNAYGQLIVAKGADTGLQIAGGYSSQNLWFRGWGYGPSGDGFWPWRTILHDANWTTYIDGRYVRDYGQQVNVGSLNNLDGRYMVNLDGYGPINTAGGPDGSYNAGLIGIGNSTRGHQIYMPYDSANMYVRRGQGGWQGWMRVLNTSADPYPANMNQYVRTSDSPTFNGLTINGTTTLNGQVNID